MEENSRLLFDNLVKNYKDQLKSIAERDDKNDENCTKYKEMLEKFEQFTDCLILNASRFLEVIKYLKDELDKSDFDSHSSASNGSEDKAAENLNFVRECLENRVELEQKAMKALMELESILQSLVDHNRKLTNENEELHAQTHGLEMNGNMTSKVIDTLNQENEELKAIISRNKQTMNLIRSKSPAVHDRHASDYEDKLEAMKQQINEKEKIISELRDQLDNCLHFKKPEVKTEKLGATAPEPLMSKESIGQDSDSDNSTRPKRSLRSKSDENGPTLRDSHSLTDSERRDQDKVKYLQEGYKELHAILKEKYQQLRQQRHQIADLKKMLEKCRQDETNAMELKDLAAKLRNKNQQLKEEAQGLKAKLEDLDKDKGDREANRVELQELKEHKVLIERKLTMQTTQIESLMDERLLLLQMNNEMMNSISACKKELCKFNFDPKC